MNMTLRDFVTAAIDTVRNPKEGARRVMAIEMPRQQRWEFLLLIVITSIILAEITVIMSGEDAGDLLGGSAIGNPLMLGAVQLFFLVVLGSWGFDCPKHLGCTRSFKGLSWRPVQSWTLGATVFSNRNNLSISEKSRN